MLMAPGLSGGSERKVILQTPSDASNLLPALLPRDDYG